MLAHDYAFSIQNSNKEVSSFTTVAYLLSLGGAVFV